MNRRIPRRAQSGRSGAIVMALNSRTTRLMPDGWMYQITRSNSVRIVVVRVP